MSIQGNKRNVSEVGGNSKRLPRHYCSLLTPKASFEKCIKLALNKGGGGRFTFPYSPAFKEMPMVTHQV